MNNLEKCECKHDGSTWSEIYCKACGTNNCKNCINYFQQKFDKWSADWNIPLFVEARQELIDIVEEIKKTTNR